MNEQFPSEEPVLLPEQYVADDATVQAAIKKVADLPEDAPAPRQRQPRPESRSGPVTTRHYDPEVLRTAIDLAAGNLGLLDFGPDFIVVERPKHDKSI